MIGSLRGRVLDRRPEEVLVEVGGVGYRVVTSPATAAALGEVEGEVFVWVHHHVREDAETLYGFISREERLSFEALLGAHGVGPALALAILSVHTPSALVRILDEDDVSGLCLVPGVGKKTAARLMIELKARLDVLDAEFVVAGRNNGSTGSGQAAGGTAPTVAPGASARSDVRTALNELGYSPEEVRAATADLPDDGDAATLLRAALAQLATGGS